MTPGDSYSFSIRRSTGGAEATYQLWRAAANFSDDDSYRTHLAVLQLQFKLGSIAPVVS